MSAFFCQTQVVYTWDSGRLEEGNWTSDGDITHSTTEAGLTRQEYVTCVCCPGLSNPFPFNEMNSCASVRK